MAVRLSRVVAWLTVTLGLVAVVLLLGGMASLQAPQVQQWLGDRIKQAVGQTLDAQLDFDKLSGSIIGGLHVKNAALRKDGRLLVSAGEISATYSLFRLLGDDLEISSVFGRDVWVDLPGVTALGAGEGGAEGALIIKRITVDGGALRPGGMMGPVEGVSAVKARCSLSVKNDLIKIDGLMETSNWFLGKLPHPIAVSSRVQLDGSKLSLENLRAASGGARAAGRIDVDWTSKVRLKGKVQVNGLDQIGLAWPSQLPPQTASADIEVAGAYNALDIAIVWPEIKAKLNGHMSLYEGLCKVDSFVFKAPWGGLKGGLRWRWEKGLKGLEWAEILFDKLCPPPFLLGKLPKWATGVQLSGKAVIDRKDGHLNLNLGLGNCCLASGVDLPGLQASCRLGGQDVGLDYMAADLGWGQLSATGAFDFDKADLELTLSTSDLTKMAMVGHSVGLLTSANFHGQATVDAKIRGPWSSPAVQVQARLHDFKSPNMTAGDLALTADVKDPAGKPMGKFTITAENMVSGDVKLDTGRVGYTRSPGGSRMDFKFDGRRLRIGGSLHHASAKWLPPKGQLTDLLIWEQSWGEWTQQRQAELAIIEGGISVAGLQLFQNGQQVSLDGMVDFAGPVNAQLRLNNIAVATFQSLTGGQPTRGRLTAQASLSGQLDNPVAKLSGVVDEIGGRHLPDCDFNFQGNYSEDVLDIQGKIVARGKPVLTFSAVLGLEISLRPPLAKTTEKGITARLWAEDVPMAAFGGYLPWIYNPKGNLSVNVNCKGSWEDPDLQGLLELKGASFVLPQTGQGPKDINIRLELQGRTVFVRQFNVTSAIDSTPLALSGKVDLPFAQQGQYDLRLSGKDVEISLGDLGWVRTVVDLSLVGPMGAAMLSGKVEPFKAFVHYRMLPSADMDEVVILRPGQEPPPIGQSKTQWRPGGWLGGLSIDAAVDLSRGLRIEMQDGWLELGGAMTIKKQPGKWIVYGDTIRLQGGLILVFGRRVQLLRGVLDFGDKQKVDPNMDVEARLSLGGSTKVFAAITGTPSDPSVHLSSQPPMNQADLLSTIVFGRPASELSGDQQNYLSAQAIALLGFQGSQALRRIVGPELAPDVITVHDSAQYGASLEAGKYIGDALYLRYRKNLSSDGGQNVGLEYQFNRSWSVDSQVGDSRDTGVDVFYSMEWGK